MAVSWRRAHTPSIESQKWRVLDLDGRHYLVKALFEDQGYHVMVSDTAVVWEEDIEAREILRRGKRLNPNIEVPLPVLLGNLSTTIEDTPPEASLSLDGVEDPSSDSYPPDTITLSLHTSFSSVPFKWEFVCSKASPKALSSHLIEPLLCMVSELQHRQRELNKLLIKKDKEIQDYKDQGSELSRRHLETVPFDAKAFANEMITSSHFESTAQQPLTALNQPEFHELYRDIALVKKWAGRRDFVPSERRSDLDSATTGTWAAKIPASLLPAAPPSLPSPTTSPAKDTGSDALPKDGEQDRRDALKRKLEQEKSKAKRKKKKLV